MGRAGWVGAALIAYGFLGVAYGLASGNAATSGPVVLTSLEIARAVLASTGLIALLFGLVVISMDIVHVRDSGQELSLSLSLSWVRGISVFFGLALLTYLAMQGPELLAVVWGMDRAWTSRSHDIINWTLIGMTIIWTVQDQLSRRSTH